MKTTSTPGDLGTMEWFETPSTDSIEARLAHHEGLLKGIRAGMNRQDHRIERIEVNVGRLIDRHEAHEEHLGRLAKALDRVADTSMQLSESLSNMQLRCMNSMNEMHVRFHEHQKDAAGVDHDLMVEIEKERKTWPRVAVALLLSAGATVGAIALYALPWLWHVIETAARAGSIKP